MSSNNPFINFLMQLDVLESILGVFFAILFLQSGLDKVLNWKTELTFNKEHFANTFLTSLVPLMLAILTVLELSSGCLSAAGVIFLWLGIHTISLYALILCSATLLCLFFGQRIAKDYGGAQALVVYIVAALLGISWLTL